MANIINTILNSKEISIFATAIRATSIDEILNSNCDFTIFAPTDSAFTKLLLVNPHILTDDIFLLTEILSAHIVAGNLTDLSLLQMCNKLDEPKVILTALDSSHIYVDLKDGIVVSLSDRISIERARVISVDTSAINGIIHFIDRVMMPAP